MKKWKLLLAALLLCALISTPAQSIGYGYLTNAIAHYKLDGAAADTVVADYLNVEAGVLEGGDTTDDLDIAGKLGTSLHFNGVDDYVEVDGLLTALANATTGSICAWFWYDDDGDDTYMFGLGSNEQSNLGLIVQTSASDCFKINCVVDTVLQYNATTPGDSVDAGVGAWMHVAVTHDGTAVKVYLNGSLQELTWINQTDKTVWFKALITDASNPVDNADIAAIDWNGALGFFDGRIDDLRIYTKELTQAEIDLIYNSGNGNAEGVGAGVD